CVPGLATGTTSTANIAGGVARYTQARLWQGANIVEAPQISFDRTRRSLQALGGQSGRVASVFVQKDKSGKLTPVNVTSDKLSYVDSERRAVFSGKVLVKSAETTINADSVQVLLLPKGAQAETSGASQLERIVAQGDIRIQQGNRKATGNQLVYTAADEKMVLTGTPGRRPSIFDAERGEISGDSLTFFTHDGRVLVGSGETSQTQTSIRIRDASKKEMQTLATDDIAKSYRGRRVVNGVSLHINQAEVVGLLGPNGAGKTTTFYMTVGLVPPDSGRVLVDGQDISDVPMYLRARNYGISYLPQEPSVFRKLTVEENIMAVLEVQPISWKERRRKRDQLIDELGLGHIRNNMGYALSGGERRRVEIARALCIAPKFILLDEPFSGIDPIAVLDLQKIIFDLKGSGIGVLITDHNVRETLSVTDRAYIINEGRIFRTGTPEQLGNDPEVKRVYLGESFSFV